MFSKSQQESNQRKCKDKFREIILQIKTMDNLFLVQLKIRYININHNIIILISSYPFISLINCPWLLFHGIILLSFYCIFFDCIYFVDAFSPWNTAALALLAGHRAAFSPCLKARVPAAALRRRMIDCYSCPMAGARSARASYRKSIFYNSFSRKLAPARYRRASQRIS